MSSECGRQVEGFICAVGTDLPTEEVQKRYRLGTGEVQETHRLGAREEELGIRVLGIRRKPGS